MSCSGDCGSTSSEREACNRERAKEDYRLFLMGVAGSFSNSLFIAIQHADRVNLYRLRQVFPHEVAVCRGEDKNDQ
jgi:hypothetical protein